MGSSAKRAVLGGSKQTGKAELQNKYQRRGMRDLFKNLNPKDFAKAYQQMLSIPKDEMKSFNKGINTFVNPSNKDMMKQFQTGVVDPTMNIFNKQVKPGIQEQFVGSGGAYSSALNDALAAAGRDVTTHIGSQLPQFMQNQQHNKLQALGLMPGANSNFYAPLQNALSGYQGLLGESTFQPVISQQSGLAGSAAQGVGAYFGAMSSKDVKENIQDYDKGYEEIKKMEVKSYDYKEGYGDKNRIGIIAEEAPKEIQTKLDGINAIDLYGLVSMLVNAVKELTTKVEKLEAR